VILICGIYGGILHAGCLVPSRFQRGERKTRKNYLLGARRITGLSLPIFQYPIMHCPAMISQPLIYIVCNCTALCPTKGLRRRQACRSVLWHFRSLKSSLRTGRLFCGRRRNATSSNTVYYGILTTLLPCI
jgi:hypothetical protein